MFRDMNDKEYAALVAENRLITDVQLEIERALDSLNMSQADLARAANLSDARISQILSSNGKNLQARTIARLAHILGKSVQLQFLDEYVPCKEQATVESGHDLFDFRAWTKISAKAPKFGDHDYNANDNYLADAA